MVKEVKAWADSLGKVHGSKEMAQKSDFFEEIKNITRGMLPPLSPDQIEILWKKRFELVPLILEIKGDKDGNV